MAASPSMDVPGGSGDDVMRSPGIAFHVEISDTAVSPVSSVPKRVRRRLLETPEGRSKSPSSLQEIEAKLKEADVRRQQFHEWLANKARPKVKSPPRAGQSEDLAERLQTKLVAAEQKRLELLSQEQNRLARLEEIRAAARTEVHLRAERDREELELRVESRVQQAETNRLALLEAEKQRRALVHERAAQTLLLRTTQEDKDRERVEALRSLIRQKIAAADEKREKLLKAERTRAQAVVLQARKVAKAVRRKRELESRNKKELLEARLQRAKRLRAEFLGQRGGCQGACHNNGHKMKKHGDQLCRKLTRCWRQFRRSRHTTLMLAQDFTACQINRQSMLSLPFEDVAGRITSPSTLRSTKAFLARLESRFMLSSAGGSSVGNIDHLLKRLAPRTRKAGNRTGQRQGISRVSNSTGRIGTKKDSSNSQVSMPMGKGTTFLKADEKELERYPARVFLCAYMILGHPEAVFSSRGENEVALSEAALKLVPEFEKLITTILVGPPSTCVTGPSSPRGDVSSLGDQGESTCLGGEASTLKPFSAQLSDFDASWCSYLYRFVAWKVQDAHLLEEDLIRVCCQLELSMLQKCNGADVSLDGQAIQKQVLEDQQLLRQRIRRLTGTDGVARLEAALTDSRNQCLGAREKGSPLPSPFASPQKSKGSGGSVLATSDQFSLEPKEVLPEDSSNGQDGRALENEKLVYEMLLEPNWNIMNANQVTSKSESKLGVIQAQIKKTMEDAFWNGVLEGLQANPPDYSRIVGLVEDLKMELKSIAPDSWKQELNECLDVEILRQVLNSGSHDYDYFRKLLDYALGFVLKLGAPARDQDTKTSQDLLLQELSEISSGLGEKSQISFALALVKGLRYVLQQVQVLKADISAAKIQALTPVLQGSAGVDYLQKAFAKRYALPDATSSGECSCNVKLPKTVSWLTEVEQIMEQSREELESARDVFWANSPESRIPNGLPPLASMRTGGRVPLSVSPTAVTESTASLEERQSLKWQSFETRVKLGFLKMISGVHPVTEATVSETLSLNLLRLRRAQNEYQRLIILTTALLLLRQNVAGKGLTSECLDDLLKDGKNRLEVILDDPMVSMIRIGNLLSELSTSPDTERASNGDLMTRMLNRSLSQEDAVFKRVSSAILLGLKSVMLLGTGLEGIALVSTTLQRVGATCLIDLVLNLGSSLDRLASVSCLVHGPWYTSCLVNSEQLA